MPTAPVFGIPSECASYLDPVQQELWDHLAAAGGDVGVGCAWLDAAATEGRVPKVVAEHVRAWNDAKRDDPVTYLMTYMRYAAAHADDWERDGLEPPDVEEVFGSFDPPEPVRTSKQARNDACACGSGRKFKYCHGR